MAGPQPDCSAKPTTPTMIMAKPIGTCSSISANSARMPRPPIASALMAARSSSVSWMRRRRSTAQALDIQSNHDPLHGGCDPEDDVGRVPKWRGWQLQHVGALRRDVELAGIDPEVPAREAKRYDNRDVGKDVEPAAEPRTYRRHQPERDMAALHQRDRNTAADRDRDRECTDVDNARDRLIGKPAQQAVCQRNEGQ